MLCIRSPELSHLRVASCTFLLTQARFQVQHFTDNSASALVSPALLFGHIQQTKITASTNPTPSFLFSQRSHYQTLTEKSNGGGHISSTTSSYKLFSRLLYAAFYPSSLLSINDSHNRREEGASLSFFKKLNRRRSFLP